MLAIDERLSLLHRENETHVEDKRRWTEPDPVGVDPVVGLRDQLRLEEMQLVNP